MRGRIISDWKKVRFTEDEQGMNVIDPRDRKKVFGAVQHFLRCEQLPAVKAAIQHFGSANDFPTSVLETIEKYHLVSDFDNGWQVFFKMRDYRSSNRNGFKILDVGNGLTFRETPIGGKAKIYKMAGEEVSVTFAMYSGGLGWHRTLFDDREYWDLEDNAIAFRNSYYRDKAAVGYALIEALGAGQNEAWAAPTPAALASTDANYEAIRDMNTIKAAVLGILTDCKDKPYGLGVGTVFQLLAPLALMPRINRALGLLNRSLSGEQKGVPYTVKPTYTLSLSSSTVYYIGVQGIKNIWGDRMDLTLFDRFDMLDYTDTAVGWARFGGAIGDVEQIRRCAIA